MKNIPSFRVGNKEAFFGQGGMGVGVSLRKLSSAVANEGGIGTIAGVGIGALKGIYKQALEANSSLLESLGHEERKKLIEQIYINANCNALHEEISEAKELRNGNGILAVNIMHALSDHKQLVRTSQEAGIEMIVTGAGAFLDLPKYVDDSMLIAPIVSSEKGAKVFLKKWSKYGHPPNAIIYEGPLAGGHLGFSKEQLQDKEFRYSALKNEIPKIVEAVKPYRTDENPIPVLGAGGIFYGGDIRTLVELGASGAQMGTRFVTTDECDAHIGFKEQYVNCSEEDMVIIDSPVGMPGSAINNQFLQDRADGVKNRFKCYYKCLRSCKQSDAKYCIAEALIDPQYGNFERGYAFGGANAPLCHDIVSVKTLVERLDQEYGDFTTSGSIAL